MMQEDLAVTKYLTKINEYPKYDREQEAKLAFEIAQGDSEALNKLVEANLRYVVIIAKKYLGSGMSLSDLLNEGTIGLIEAAIRFKREKGVKFITYAVWWIRQAILFAITRKNSLVKIPVKQMHLAYMITKRIRVLSQQLGRDPEMSELADDLKIGHEEIQELLKISRLLTPYESTNNENDDYDALMMVPDDRTMRADDAVIEDSFVDDVDLLMACLDDREKEILKLHYGFAGNPLTLQQIGTKFGLTRERIRQIEQKAIKKLRTIAIRKNMKEYLR